MTGRRLALYALSPRRQPTLLRQRGGHQRAVDQHANWLRHGVFTHAVDRRVRSGRGRFQSSAFAISAGVWRETNLIDGYLGGARVRGWADAFDTGRAFIDVDAARLEALCDFDPSDFLPWRRFRFWPTQTIFCSLPLNL